MFGEYIWRLYVEYVARVMAINILEYSEEEQRTIAVVLGSMANFLKEDPEVRRVYGVDLVPNLKKLYEAKTVLENFRRDSEGSITIRQLQKAVHENAKNKGWWDDDLYRTFGDQIALFHTEISEAMLDYQNNKEIDEIYYEGDKPCGIPIELADVVIRIMDTCEKYGIDLEDALLMKTEYNKLRPFRHGGKRL